jgi:allophanate hydrolase subunit 1
MIDAGVDPHVAAKVTGHRSMSVFYRYAIVDRKTLAKTLERLQEHREAQKA